MNKKSTSQSSKDKASISSSKASSKTATKKPTEEQIAMRAYFISEERRQTGRSGDHLSDWRDAEQQLIAEAK